MGLGPFGDLGFDIHRELFARGTTFHTGNPLETWLVSGGIVPLDRGSHLQVDTLAGVDRAYWVKEEPERTMYQAPAWLDEQYFRVPHVMSCWICKQQCVSMTATSYMGIGLGTPDNNALLPMTAAANAHPFLQIRCRLDTGVWEFVTCPGDGSTDPTITPIPGAPVLVQNRGNHLRLEWDPIGLVATATIDGEHTVRETNPALLPPATDLGGTVTGHAAFNYFGTTGTNVLGRTRFCIGPIAVSRPGFRDAP